jgi:hypothetical protein
MRLFNEASSHVQRIRIEMVPCRGSHRSREEHPAATIGLTAWSPTILFTDSMNIGERTEAIAHELSHLLLLYRFGLRVIGRRLPPPRTGKELFSYFLGMNKAWGYLLGQVVNTVHHLILIDYLKEEYGIGSGLYRRLLHHNFCIIANDNDRDEESLYARGLIAFEYEKLMGRMGRATNPYLQPEFFWKAHRSAQKYFGRYGFRSMPTLSSYQEHILSFLEVLGYQREDFVFFPERK